MFPVSRLLLPAALLVALAACGLEKGPPRQMAPDSNRVQVERMLYRHVVDFPAQARRPGESERRALQRFLGETGADRDATVVVTAGAGEAAQARGQSVVRMLRRMGFRPRPADPLLDPKPAARGQVLVRVARYHAIPPECPDYTRPRVGDVYNLPSSNFGCATNRNLGLMVSNPRDLLRGRDLAPADGERQARTIEHYRSGRKPDLILFGKDGTVVFEEKEADSPAKGAGKQE